MTYSVRISLTPSGYQVGNLALELVTELRQSGLVQDRDFVWRFQKGNFADDNTFLPASVTFEFEDPALATFYQLKWGTP